MIELLVLGLVLFIVGVGATFLYDKHKDNLTIPNPKTWWAQVQQRVEDAKAKELAQKQRIRDQRYQAEQLVAKASQAYRNAQMKTKATKKTMTGQEFLDMMNGKRPDLEAEWMPQKAIQRAEQHLQDTDKMLNDRIKELEKRLKGYK